MKYSYKEIVDEVKKVSLNCGPEAFPYIIQPGDSLWDLAGRYDTSIETIIAINPGVSPHNLFIGQVICVPGDPPSARKPELERKRREELERRRREELERRRRKELERRRREERKH